LPDLASDVVASIRFFAFCGAHHVPQTVRAASPSPKMIRIAARQDCTVRILAKSPGRPRSIGLPDGQAVHLRLSNGKAANRGRCMADDRLIVALDVPNAIEGLELAERLGDAVGFYKIGLGMLTSGGLALANELKQDHGKRIFLDMKLFDIGATVEAAVRGLAQFDLDFLTVHGDPHVVRAAKEGAAGTELKILAVTILTSLDRADLDACMIRQGDIPELVQSRALRAFEAGADGVIASPREAERIHALPEAEGRLIVTPGVRPAGAELGDQKRVATPAKAIEQGADHIVVGRPIWKSADPKAAAQAILKTLPQKQAHRTKP